MGCRLGSSSRSLCFPGQEQPGPSSSGSRSILPALCGNPEPSSEPKYGGALAPVPLPRAPPSLPSPRQCGGGSWFSTKSSWGWRGGKGRLAPQRSHPDPAAWMYMHPLASLPPSLLPLPPADPPALAEGMQGRHRAGAEQNTPPPPPNTHAFQRLYPSESQRLENSSYSSIFIFFGYNFSFGHVVN